MVPVPPHMSFEAGQAIGPYHLLRRVERGMDEPLWLARRANAAGVFQPYMIALPAPHVADRDAAAWFEPLVRLAPYLQHPNLLAILEHGSGAEVPHVVYEWVDGVTLGSMLAPLASLAERDAPAAISIIGHVIEQVAKALAFAHACTAAPGRPQGIVHRQLSPDRILVSVTGDVKVHGFGVADRPHDATSGFHAHGLLRYVPPEQLGGGSHAPTFDLFALGAILHELLEGRAFRGEHTEALALYRAAMAREVPVLSRAVPAEVERTRFALLQPDAIARVPDCTTLLRMVARWPLGDDRRDACARLVRAAIEGATPGATPRQGPGPLDEPAVASPQAAVQPIPLESIRRASIAREAGPASAPIPSPNPSPSPSLRAPPLADDGDGTVQLDPAVLAAMRAASRGTRSAAAAPAAHELAASPPATLASAAVSARPAATPSPPSPPRAPSQPRSPSPPASAPVPVPHRGAAFPQPSAPHPPTGAHSPQPGAPVPRPSSAPSSPQASAPIPRRASAPMIPAPNAAARAAPLRGPASRPEPRPDLESTTSELVRRRSLRRFVLLIGLGVLTAIGLGVGVGSLLITEDPPGASQPKPRR